MSSDHPAKLKEPLRRVASPGYRAPEEVRLIVSDDHETLFFSSVAAAESYLEAIDVEDGRTHAYDVEGRHYSVEAKGLGTWSAGRVVIELQPGEPELDAVEQLLLAGLAYDSRIGPDWELADLLERARRDLSA